LGTTTEFPALPVPAQARAGLQPPGRTALQPSDEITRSLFGRGRRVARTHPLAIDALVVVVLLALSMAWLAQSPFAGFRAGIVQAVRSP